MIQTKEKIETVFRQMGLTPAAREKHGDYEIFYGDGFSKPPHLRWQNTNAIQPEDFPLGAFVTFWWIGRDEKLLLGRPLFMNWTETSQSARINAARKDALQKLKKLRKLH